MEKKIAKEFIALLDKLAQEIESKLQANIKSLKQSNLDVIMQRNLEKQLCDLQTQFNDLPRKIDLLLNKISDNFSITLFGRTMAGKSTLKEILTNGDGSSIGNGSQRTTKDVREYCYKNLTITDVPGIAAFGEGGIKDEKVAFEAAQKSDLILFLITKGAPQASEAECLSKILSLGKPVICIINIKAEIETNSSIKLFERDIQKKISHDRISELKRQFYDFGRSNNQYWDDITFVTTHLKSAFLSQKLTNKEESIKLYNLSNFKEVEKIILKTVNKKGKFYKLKSPLDTVYVHSFDIFESLFKQSIENSGNGKILIGKKDELAKWTEQFKKDSSNAINGFIIETKKI